MSVNQHILQSLDSMSTNWIFHFEFKVTSDTLGHLDSEMSRVIDGQESSLGGVSVADSLTLNIDNFMFQTIKNVYHKVAFTNIFLPLHNACLKEIRMDGKFVKSIITPAKSRTNVKVYATWPGGSSQTQNVAVRNFYLFDLDKDI